MKLNMSVNFLVLGFFIIIHFSVAQSAMPNTKGFNTPQGVVTDFYMEYLSALNDRDVASGLRSSQGAIDKYTSKHLRELQDLNDSGADYFFSAQDACPDWLNNISTSHVSKNGENADVRLNLGYGSSLSVYDIHVVMKKGRWLMDSVKFKSRKTESCYHK